MVFELNYIKEIVPWYDPCGFDIMASVSEVGRGIGIQEKSEKNLDQGS